MPINRFFYPGSLQEQRITLEGEECRHLQVLRTRPGEEIDLVNGKGDLAQARLVQLSRKGAELEVISREHHPAPKTAIILAQALVRPAALDWIIEKGTELGASAFWLFPGEGSEKAALSPQQEKRVHSLTISALKQCGRLYLPSISLKPPLRDWTAPEENLLFGSLNPQAPRISRSHGPAIFAVGPEKGFSKSELAILEETLNARGIKLSDNILRAETAAIAALAQLI